MALGLLRMLGRDSFDLRRVATQIMLDPALTARILQIANSPMFGFRSEIRSVEHALILVGYKRVFASVVTALLGGYLDKNLRLATVARCWRHSLACALVARVLAARSKIDPELAYTAALLHEIGRLVLLNAYPVEYARMLETAEPGDDLIDFERRLFESDHRSISAWLMTHWSLPDEFVATVNGDPTHPLAALVQQASEAADSLGYGVAPGLAKLERPAILSTYEAEEVDREVRLIEATLPLLQGSRPAAGGATRQSHTTGEPSWYAAA